MAGLIIDVGGDDCESAEYTHVYFTLGGDTLQLCIETPEAESLARWLIEHGYGPEGE